MVYGGPNDLPTTQTLWACDQLAVVWCVILAVSVGVYRKRALWQLVGAPFSLLWPVGFTVAQFVGR